MLRPCFDYFWLTPLPAGSIVRVPLGRRTVSALVVDAQDVRTAKLTLKRAGFELKKLSGVVTDAPQVSPVQVRLAEWLTTQYACSLATAIRTVVPPFFAKPRSLIDHSSLAGTCTMAPVTGDVLVTQPDTARTALLDIVAHAQGQVFVLTPDLTVAESLKASLPHDAALIHSTLPSAKLRALYRGVLDGSVRTVVGTRSGLFLPWSSLAHVVVEDPLHEMYKSDMAPRFNAPDVARQLASLHHARLTWFTPALSTVQHHLMSSGSLPVTDRKPHWPRVIVTTAQAESEAGHRSIFAREAREALLDAYDRRASVLIVSARRAYATVARCTSCRTALLCPTCAIPMRWHRTSEDMLVCYHCATARTVPRQCESCHNGLVRPAGVPGSQKLAEAVNGILDRVGYATAPVPLLDTDLVRDAHDVRRVLTALDAMQHPILIATAMADSLRYDRTFDTILIPHADILMSDPDYRSADRFIARLEKLADFHPSTMVLQTIEADSVAAYAPSRDWTSFFTRELQHRKALRWPPFSRVVKLSFAHRSRTTVARAAAVAADRIARAITHLRAQGTRLLGPSTALVERGGGQWTQVIVLKSSLPSARLAELLRYVPDGWTVDVDPRSIA